jgi:glycosyltransferase involved in cell wall biosynthesis
VRDCLVIIPAYNEGGNIKKVLTGLKKTNPYIDILVVNDGSTDNTEAVVRAEKVRLISLPFNLGYGGALQAGFKYAVSEGYRYVVQFDGDGQHDPEDIKTILNLLEKGYDIVIGSRFLGRGAFKTGFLKRMAINVFRLVIKASTGVKVTDPSSGLQGLSRRTFRHYSEIGHFPPDYPDADVLIQMILSGFKVVEFPANIRGREYGRSMHAGLRPLFYFIKMLVSILVVLLRPKLKRGG